MPPPYAKGYVRAPNKNHLIDLAFQRNQHKLRALAQVSPPPAFDSRTKNWLGPVKDQSSCGSCWDFSGTGVVEVAYAVAGLGPVVLSEEYTLDCGQNGGCSGDDNVTVLEWAKKTGLPSSQDYGPYKMGGRCAYKSSMHLYKVDDWGFADQSGGNGVTPTDMIKQAIMTYGCVGCAVAAGGDSFWNDGQGVGTGRSHSIDHDVILVGWDDSKGPGGAWIMRNSWGTSWGSMQGYAWIGYGAYDIGTEAVFALVKNPAKPLDPTLWG